MCLAPLNVRRPQHHGSSHREDIKLGLRCSHGTRLLETSGCHLCRISSNSGSHSPQANRDTHRMESRKINQRPSMYYHWLELISKYKSLKTEKIASSIEITLALQSARGQRLANALFLSISEMPTWNDIHGLYVNYFNNNVPADSKEINQFDVRGKVSREESVNQVGKRKGEVKRTIKGSGFLSESESEQRKGKSYKIKRKGQWTTWSGQSWPWKQGQGGKGKGKGHQACPHYDQKGHSVDQCWWGPKTSFAGSSSDTRDKFKTSQNNSEDFRTSDLFINNLTINPT